MNTKPRPRLTTLRADVTSLAFRAICDQLMADPVLSATVKSWQTWEGTPGDKTPTSPGQTPWVLLTPRPAGEAWNSPEAQIGWLYVQIETCTLGTCVDDVLNLWGAIRQALSPSDLAARQAWWNRLQQIVSAKGVIEMSQPLIDTTADAGQDEQFRAVGQVRVQYRSLVAS